MVAEGGAVVGAGGVDLAVEAAEEDRAAMDRDRRLPPGGVATSADALVRRAIHAPAELGAVAGVLRAGGGAEVGLAIVPAVLVDVIDEHAGRRRQHLAVHRDALRPPVAQTRGAGGVIRPRPLADVPVVAGQARIVIRINDGVAALGQRDPAEGVAVADPTPQQRQRHAGPSQPQRNGHNDLDGPRLHSRHLRPSGLQSIATSRGEPRRSPVHNRADPTSALYPWRLLHVFDQEFSASRPRTGVTPCPDNSKNSFDVTTPAQKGVARS